MHFIKERVLRKMQLDTSLKMFFGILITELLYRCHWAGKTGQRSAVQKRPVTHYIA